MIGRQLIDALRGPGAAPPPPVPLPGPFVPLYAEEERAAPVPPAVPQMPPGTLGWAVARQDGQGRTVLTHTSLMPRSEAQREAGAQRAADRSGYGWSVVEIRRVVT